MIIAIYHWHCGPKSMRSHIQMHQRFPSIPTVHRTQWLSYYNISAQLCFESHHICAHVVQQIWGTWEQKWSRNRSNSVFTVTQLHFARCALCLLGKRWPRHETAFQRSPQVWYTDRIDQNVECILMWVFIDSEPLSSDWINKLDKLLTDLL